MAGQPPPLWDKAFITVMRNNNMPGMETRLLVFACTKPPVVTNSLGMAYGREDAPAWKNSVHRADTGLYAAKTQATTAWFATGRKCTIMRPISQKIVSQTRLGPAAGHLVRTHKNPPGA